MAGGSVVPRDKDLNPSGAAGRPESERNIDATVRILANQNSFKAANIILCAKVYIYNMCICLIYVFIVDRCLLS